MNILTNLTECVTLICVALGHFFEPVVIVFFDYYTEAFSTGNWAVICFALVLPFITAGVIVSIIKDLVKIKRTH